MTPRMTDYINRAEEGFKSLFALEAAIKGSPIEPQLMHLIKIRASQMNACAYCIQMHTAEALKNGEEPLRLYMLPAWRESPMYSERERAGLAWTEALTLLADTGAPDRDWAKVEAAFSPNERAWLSLAIGSINVWNRIQVGFRAQPASTLPPIKSTDAA